MTRGNEPGLERSAIEQRAAAVLGVAPDASRESACTAFLEHVAEEDGLPALNAREALELLIGRRSPAGCPLLAESVRRSDQDQLAQRVEQFASAFFTLAVAERCQRWHELVAACRAIGPLAARLQRLHGALSIDPATFGAGSAEARQLVEHVLELFVLHPRLEPVRRHALLAAVRGGSEASVRRWQKAVRQLKRRHPNVAALAPVFLADLDLPGNRSKAKRHVAAAAPSTKPTGVFASPSWLILGLVIAVAGSAMRALNRYSRNGLLPSIVSPPLPAIPIQPQPFLPEMLKLPPNAYLSYLTSPARERFKEKLRLRLKELGYVLGDEPLEGVLKHRLAVSVLLSLGGTREELMRVRQAWKSELAVALRESGISVDDQELDGMFRLAFPGLADRIGPSPGVDRGARAPSSDPAPMVRPARPSEVPAP